LHTPERHLPTPGQHGHSPQRHTAAGTAAPTTADTGNTVQLANKRAPPATLLTQITHSLRAQPPVDLPVARGQHERTGRAARAHRQHGQVCGPIAGTPMALGRPTSRTPNPHHTPSGIHRRLRSRGGKPPLDLARRVCVRGVDSGGEDSGEEQR